MGCTHHAALQTYIVVGVHRSLPRQQKLNNVILSACSCPVKRRPPITVPFVHLSFLACNRGTIGETRAAARGSGTHTHPYRPTHPVRREACLRTPACEVCCPPCSQAWLQIETSGGIPPQRKSGSVTSPHVRGGEVGHRRKSNTVQQSGVLLVAVNAASSFSNAAATSSWSLMTDISPPGGLHMARASKASLPCSGMLAEEPPTGQPRQWHVPKC